MTFGNKLQNLRKERNMNQEDLSNLLNVSRQAISKWETDQSLPDITNIIAISEIFNVSTDYLLLDKKSAGNQEKSSKGKFITLSAIIFSSLGFLGNFASYIFSRFIKVPAPIARVRNGADGEWRTVMGLEHNFFRFISQQDLWLLFWFFTLLFILGIALLAYQYHAEIKSFISKLSVKLKSLIRKSK